MEALDRLKIGAKNDSEKVNNFTFALATLTYVDLFHKFIGKHEENYQYNWIDSLSKKYFMVLNSNADKPLSQLIDVEDLNVPGLDFEKYPLDTKKMISIIGKIIRNPNYKLQVNFLPDCILSLPIVAEDYEAIKDNQEEVIESLLNIYYAVGNKFEAHVTKLRPALVLGVQSELVPGYLIDDLKKLLSLNQPLYTELTEDIRYFLIHDVIPSHISHYIAQRNVKEEKIRKLLKASEAKKQIKNEITPV